MTAEPLVLVLGTADWNAPVATNQHRVTAALAASWPVVFVEGAGTRSLRPADARRVLRRLRPAPTLTGRPLPAGVEVVSPRVVPHHGGATRPVNTALLHRQVRRWVQHPGPRLLWTFTPFTYGLERLADRTVYHLVDLLHENPGVHRGRLLDAERRLRADLALATSPAVREHLHEQGFTTTRLLPNVCDVALFTAAARATTSRGTSAVFAGTLAPHKLDGGLLLDLARVLGPDLRLVGPLVEPAAPLWRDLTAAGARILGPLDPPALARELASCAVGLVPYRISPLTRGISPLKTFEYLAAGLPVVSTPLPAVAPVDGAVFVREAPAFPTQVQALLAQEDPDRPARMTRLADGHDWESRGRRLRALAGELLAG
ncbi:glycosyltransferase [Kineococcus sp. LSe6-4]|uniref:Glycosyltransferase n=1 Tax=Kineococcus halophytocola TaxID=3234027 RepID=A0ABV4H5B4_9ACTN